MYRISNVGPQRGVGNPEIKSTPLMVNGILYFTIPDHVWALDARTGEELWHYGGKITAAIWWAIAASACTATGCTS
jgi:glucose dehydrogenase